MLVQYGCGLCAPETWINFDSSPTLRIQKNILLNLFFKGTVKFPKNVLYGDILKGLPNIKNNSCDAVYCSHTLEHISLSNIDLALANTLKILKPGGIFRCLVPDLESLARLYLEKKKSDKNAAHEFMELTGLGFESKLNSLRDYVKFHFGNATHMWMWDHDSLTEVLYKVGFSVVRRCTFNDSSLVAFKDVEDRARFNSAVALEAIK